MRLIRICLTGLPLLLAACGTVTYKADIAYVPQQRSPLASLKKTSVFIQVEDQRPAEERSHVSRAEGDVMVPTTLGLTRKPPTEIVLGALRQEFEHHGYQVLAAPATEGGVNLKIALKRFMGIFVGVDKIAQIEGEVSITKAGNPVAATPFLVSGTFRKHIGGITTTSGKLTDELSGALQDFIHNLTLEPRFIEVFE